MEKANQAMNQLQRELKEVTERRDQLERNTDEYQRLDKRHVSIKLLMILIDDYKQGDYNTTIEQYIDDLIK